MASDKHKRAIGIFPNRPATASALQALRDAGFSVHDITVITRDGSEEGAIAGVEVHDSEGNSAKSGAKTGAFAGGLLGSAAGALVGVGALTIPGLAPVVVLGEAAAVLVSILAGGAIGAAAGGLVGALVGLGVPHNRAKVYGDRVNRGEYLVMLKGTERSLQRAEEILHHHGVGDWGVYEGRDRAGAVGVDPRQANSYNRADQPMEQGIPNRAGYVAPVNPRPSYNDDYPSDRPVDPSARTVSNDIGYTVNPVENSRPLEDDYRGVERDDRTVRNIDSSSSHVHPVPPLDDRSYTDYHSDRLEERPVRDPSSNIGYVAPVTPINQVSPVEHYDRPVVNEGNYVSRDEVRPYPEERDRIDQPMAAGMAGGHLPLQRSEKRSIGAFPNQFALERALEVLRQSGFPMHKVSIIIRDTEGQPNVAQSSSPMNPMGRYTGFLVGSNRFDVPGIGPILVMGSEAAAFSDAFADKKVGIFPTDFVETLTKLGIPQVQARIYRDRLAHDGSLVMVRGTGDEALQAASALNRSGIQDWGVYSV